MTMLKLETTGGTTHFVDVVRGARMRVPGPGRGEHAGDGGWVPCLGVSGFEHGTLVAVGVGRRVLFSGPDGAWHLTSPVVAINECDGP